MIKPETRILVVEDDPYIAELLQLQLQHRKLKVRCEYDGPSGLKAVTAFDPEVIILEFMVRNPRRALSRKLLLSRVWGEESRAETNVVDVYVTYLRKKLEDYGEPRLIQTVRGVGYALRER